MVKDIYSKEFQEKIKNSNGNAVLIDVRTKEEFDEGHIPGALNYDIHLPEFFEQLEGLARDKVYLVYCRSGMRSATACRYMETQGFKELYNLAGGIISWNGDVEN